LCQRLSEAKVALAQGQEHPAVVIDADVAGLEEDEPAGFLPEEQDEDRAEPRWRVCGCGPQQAACERDPVLVVHAPAILFGSSPGHIKAAGHIPVGGRPVDERPQRRAGAGQFGHPGIQQRLSHRPQ
jgi:hypothetical protein